MNLYEGYIYLLDFAILGVGKYDPFFLVFNHGSLTVYGKSLPNGRMQSQ